MASTRKLFSTLTRKGPHKVLRGDLAFAGLPGVVYTPAEGLNLPGIAFGHEWVTGARRYDGTLEHLASWGIVAAAPDTERSLAPSALNLAADLGTTLDIVAGVRLGAGKISVHPTKLGVAGHGFGASAAVLLAADTTRSEFTPSAVAAIFPTVVKPSTEDAVAGLSVPGLVLSAPGDPQTLRSNAVELARSWDGAVLRTVDRGKAGGMAEGGRIARIVGLPGTDKSTQKTVRALVTGFLLYTLAGDKDYKDFADAEADLPKSGIPGPDETPIDVEDKIVALLKP